MNQLQRYLEDQKQFYNLRIAKSDHYTLRQIKAMFEMKQAPYKIIDQVIRWNGYLIDLYSRLLISNLEGEIIKIIKEGRSNHETDWNSLFNDWQLPDNRTGAPPVDPQVSLAEISSDQRTAAAADESENIGLTD